MLERSRRESGIGQARLPLDRFDHELRGAAGLFDSSSSASMTTGLPSSLPIRRAKSVFRELTLGVVEAACAEARSRSVRTQV